MRRFGVLRARDRSPPGPRPGHPGLGAEHESPAPGGGSPIPTDASMTAGFGSTANVPVVLPAVATLRPACRPLLWLPLGVHGVVGLRRFAALLDGGARGSGLLRDLPARNDRPALVVARLVAEAAGLGMPTDGYLDLKHGFQSDPNDPSIPRLARILPGKGGKLHKNGSRQAPFGRAHPPDRTPRRGHWHPGRREAEHCAGAGWASAGFATVARVDDVPRPLGPGPGAPRCRSRSSERKCGTASPAAFRAARSTRQWRPARLGPMLLGL